MPAVVTQWENLWELSRRLLQPPPSRAYASTLGDLQDASALLLFMDQTCDFREEQVLGAVIGLLYTTELFSASPQAKSDCACHLSASGVQVFQLDCFVAYGEHLLANGFQSTGGGDRDNMTEGIEDAWLDFCTARGVQVVRSEVEDKYPVFPAEDEAELFSSPFRRKRSKKKKKKTKKRESDASSSSSSSSSGSGSSSMNPRAPTWPLGFSGDSVPTFFELAHRILHSKFFLSLPLENLGHNYQRFCKETKDPDGWVKAYAEMARTEPVLPVDSFRSPEESSYPLLRSQLRKLLEGLRSHGRGTLLRALFTSRPPLSMLPHIHAMVDCTVHARLWLLGIDHTIYMESELSYADLGCRGAAKEQQEVYTSIYLQERVPSCVELLQRLQCHSCLCGSWGGVLEVLVLTPQDYDTLGAPDNEMWRAVRKHIRYSMFYAEGKKVDPELVLPEVVRKYRPFIHVDRKWARLHPSLVHAELLQVPPMAPNSSVVFLR
ncbi:uncharacterized protein LOC112350353 [Selaginella moellendorffii]|uniref:uncharacterized protein LOC112350353 n=1 Tax=Selaginella moellendorffii TaxID=88036 RepID=UPI000D1CF2D4|nr:uncharacterized protein LOC112350353 [Selaginella moellendorffii]|eukprot:XP_024542117.1 uncharacterized protein LOC112350353 [Selaginella moellendorffii]